MDTATAAQPRKQRQTISDRVDAAKPAAIIINERFDGLTHFCKLTGYPTSTAHGWLTSGFIPPQRKGASIHGHIMATARENEIEMSPSDFIEQPVAALAANG